MPGPWPITPETFDGAAFARRYALDPFTDFFATRHDDGLLYLHVAPGAVVPDQPIFEAPAPDPDAVRARAILAADPATVSAVDIRWLTLHLGRKLYGAIP